MNPTHFDTIIVGSGFGGSVMAYRLAEAGQEVCLLEKGKAYPPGSFSRSPYSADDNFWDPKGGHYGLFDLWSFHRIHALVASGLGGGSLIYANVLLRKDEAWFVKEDLSQGGYENWPVTRADLEPHYDRVETMLSPQPYPFGHAPYSGTSKTQAFWTATKRAGLEPFFPGLAVTFANGDAAPIPGEPIHEAEPNLHNRTRLTCRLCGECDVGCNYGSKNTLDYTYLSAAARCGAELRTGCEVKSFAPREGGGYTVTYVEHPLREVGAAADPAAGTSHTLTADRLVLSAGALGSTYLLLGNRIAFPRLSRRLGSRFSGNGDLLTFARRRSGAPTDPQIPTVIDPTYGPVITSAARVGDALDGHGASGRGFYLEDAGFPAHLAWALQVAAAPGPLLSLLCRRFAWDWLGKGADTRLGSQIASLLSGNTLAAGVLPLLGMGRDVPDGRLKLRAGRLDVDWNRRASKDYFRRARATSQRVARELGASFADNPMRYLNRLVTVHPLGGCPMGRNEEEGVVDSYGEVFNYPNLYVVDGSMMPGPVGANPSLTIAALADRCADRLLENPRRHA